MYFYVSKTKILTSFPRKFYLELTRLTFSTICMSINQAFIATIICRYPERLVFLFSLSVKWDDIDFFFNFSAEFNAPSAHTKISELECVCVTRGERVYCLCGKLVFFIKLS